MKIRYLLSIPALTLVAGITFAGAINPVPVTVDLDNQSAFGNMWTARTAKDDVSLIGCGTRNFDDGNDAFVFGFCQAQDSDENFVVCFTENPSLLDTMRATADYSFVTFSWTGDAQSVEGGECIFIGFSTQSFYLPNATTKGQN